MEIHKVASELPASLEDLRRVEKSLKQIIASLRSQQQGNSPDQSTPRPRTTAAQRSINSQQQWNLPASALYLVMVVILILLILTAGIAVNQAARRSSAETEAEALESDLQHANSQRAAAAATAQALESNLQVANSQRDAAVATAQALESNLQVANSQRDAAVATAQALENDLQSAQSEIRTQQQALVTAVDWPLQSAPDFGPTDVKLDHKDDNLIELHFADVNSSDFVVKVNIYNPYDQTEGTWDYGVAFRYNAGTFYYFVITSNGDWQLKLRTSDNGTDQANTLITSGQIVGMNPSAGNSTELKLLAKGKQGLVLINGDYVATLDLSANQSDGDIAVGTGFFNGDEIAGHSTRFDKFTIWKLP